MLPKIPYSMEKNKSVTIPIGNLNLSSNFKPGDIADSYGISARKYPYITTRTRNISLEGEWEEELSFELVDVYDFYRWDDRNVVVGKMNTIPYGYSGLWIQKNGKYSYIDEVEIGKKQFIPINTKLVILPDKLYLDSTDSKPVLHKLEAQTDLISSVNDRRPSIIRRAIPKEFTTSYFTYGYFSNDRFIFMEKTDIVSECMAVRNEDGTEFRTVKKIGKATIEPASDAEGEKRYKFILSSDTDPDFFDDALLRNYRKPIYYSKDGVLYSATYKGKTTQDGSVLYQLDSTNFATEDEVTLYLPSYFSNIMHVSTNKKYYFKFGNALLTGAYPTETSGGKITLFSPIDFLKAWIAPLTISTFAKTTPGPLSGAKSVYFDSIDSINDGLFASNFTNEAAGLKVPACLPDAEIREYNIYHSSSSFSRINNLTNLFKVGDTVVAKSSYQDFGEKTFTITALTPGSISTSTDIFTPGEYPDMTIERRFPNLDFACECHNRLFGCSNSDKTIYVSALGDPTNMMTYEGVSTDSFAVAVAGEGDFTACCAHDSSVLFWKERQLHKLTGYNPSDFALYTYQVDGVQAGCERSAQIINEVLYYKGVSGVFAYAGGIPQLISQNFGERKFRGAVGGVDGEAYYVSMKDGTTKEDCLISFNTRSGLWVLEDKIKCDAFVRLDDGTAYLSGGKVYMMTDNEAPREIEWMAQFVPFYETIEGKKTYSRLLMRTELPKGSYMIIEVRSDDGPWCEAGKIVGANKGIIPIRLPIARCDKFEIRLSGKGAFVLHEILREYHVGSEV